MSSAPPVNVSNRTAAWRFLAIALLAAAPQLFVIGLGWQATKESGWRNYVLEDSWMYRGMADMIRERGIVYDSNGLDPEIRVRSPGLSADDPGCRCDCAVV